MQDHEAMKGRVWQLLLGDALLTEITMTRYEFPWTYGEVSDIAAFNRVRTYFHDPDEWPDTADFNALVEFITQNGGFVLRDLRDAAAYQTFTLNAEHDTNSATIWFRQNAVEAVEAEADTV